MRFTLQGARLVDAEIDIPAGSITVEGKQILTVGYAQEQGQIVDARDALVLPGFIDVHTHGGGGFNLHTADAEEIVSYTRWVVSTGVTAFLIGVVGTPNALPEAQLRAAVRAIEHCEENEIGALPLGIHMEGPYINFARRGAHLPTWLRKPDPEETEHILALTSGHLRLITLAPELPGAHDMMRQLLEAGVTVSIGHTDATYEQAQEAIQLGATHMTHCFNAMRPINHRAPGPLAAVVEAKQVRGELIADGVHVLPPVMDMLIRMLGPKRTIVITDALAGAGQKDVVFEFAGQHAEVICGAARLADGTLTGSVLTMDQALRNVLEMTEVSMSEASSMLSGNPAAAIGMEQQKGRLRSGFDADLVVLNEKLQLQATVCRGRVLYATEEWKKRLKQVIQH